MRRSRSATLPFSGTPSSSLTSRPCGQTGTSQQSGSSCTAGRDPWRGGRAAPRRICSRSGSTGFAISRLPVPGHRAGNRRQRGAGRRDLRADQLRGCQAQPGRLHPDADVGSLGEGTARARRVQPRCGRSEGVGPVARNPFIDPSPDQLLRVAVGLALQARSAASTCTTCFEARTSTPARSAHSDARPSSNSSRAQEEVLDLRNWLEFLKCLPQQASAAAA